MSPLYEDISHIKPAENLYELVDQSIPPPYNYNYKVPNIVTQPSAPPLSCYSHVDEIDHNFVSNSTNVKHEHLFLV